MTVELDFRTAGYLWSFWLKEEHKSDCQLTGETLLTILRLLTGSRIENLVTSEALSLLSSGLNRLRSSEIINNCAPLLFGERTDNTWFSLPPVGKRERAVNVIYVNRTGRSNRIYATQYGVDNFPDSLRNANSEIFFHGTNQSNAEKITKDGIDVEIGEENRDLSDGGGFYLSSDLNDVLGVQWARGRRPCSAVLIFKVARAELRDERNGLYLNDESEPRWEEVVRNFRRALRDRSLIRQLEPYDFLEGAISGEGQSYKNPVPNPGSYQLCVRTNVCAHLFNRSLHSAMFFEEI
ncbi:hypothetical protein ABFA07_013271 [Porites harrisoni]